MAFSWKQAKKNSIKEMKERRHHKLSQGRSEEAKSLERKIKRLEDASA